LSRDLRLGTLLDKEGAKHLVTALEQLVGFEEKAAARVVHHGFSRIRVISW
jgi:hypothetical protein